MTSGWTGWAGQRARTTIDKVVAADPGLTRWHLAWRATLAVACVAFAEHWIGPAVGLPALVAMLLGGMIAMNGSFLLAGRPRVDAVLTTAGMPFVAFAGVLLAVAVDGHVLASRLGFVVLTVVAVYVRRFGIRGLNYGLLGWFAYMFGAFSSARPSQLLPLSVVFLSAVAILVILMVGVAYQCPRTKLSAALHAFDLRVAAVARACADLLADPGAKNARELHARRFYVLEAALIAEGHLASPAAAKVTPTGCAPACWPRNSPSKSSPRRRSRWPVRVDCRSRCARPPPPRSGRWPSGTWTALANTRMSWTDAASARATASP